MKLGIKVIKQVDAKYIQVNTSVRYWHDTEVNGEYDINFIDKQGEGKPNIPCAVKVKDEPETHICSDHWRWKPVIDIESGQIVNWEQGVIANVLYKVCDEFACDLLDSEKKVVHSYEGYVPDFMCPREAGYGDYIDMMIDGKGFIEDWDKSEVEDFFNAEGEE